MAKSRELVTGCAEAHDGLALRAGYTGRKPATGQLLLA
jgi:hypothetical protein